MSDREPEEQTPDVPQDEGPPPALEESGPLIPIVGEVVEQTTRFSREFVATMISLASAAFGVVAALAWNTAITAGFNHWFSDNTRVRISALFVYAAIVTLIGVTVIVLLGRLATRINAQPVEFKYPGTPKA